MQAEFPLEIRVLDLYPKNVLMKSACWHRSCIIYMANMTEILNNSKIEKIYILFTAEKAKPVVRRRRKATGLQQKTAGLPPENYGGE